MSVTVGLDVSDRMWCQPECTAFGSEIMLGFTLLLSPRNHSRQDWLPYYYARACRRIDGKPKIVWQKYLDKADDIVVALTSPVAAGQPDTAVVTTLAR